MVKKKEERYVLTPKGMLMHIVKDEKVVEKIEDALALYSYKMGIAPGNIPAMVYVDGNWEFGEVKEKK